MRSWRRLVALERDLVTRHVSARTNPGCARSTLIREIVTSRVCADPAQRSLRLVAAEQANACIGCS